MPDLAKTSSHPTNATDEVDFGANDWLLEEMFEQFSSDPGSVDPSWAQYFREHGAPGSAAPTGSPSNDAGSKDTPSDDTPSNDTPSNGAAKGQGAAPAAQPAPTAPAKAAPAPDPTPAAAQTARRVPTVEKLTAHAESRPVTPGTRGGERHRLREQYRFAGIRRRRQSKLLGNAYDLRPPLESEQRGRIRR